jgi:hypothetical protein
MGLDAGAVLGQAQDHRHERTATAEEIIACYAARWSIEVTFFDVKNILGVGEARNRTTKAVQRTVPFGLLCHSTLIVWYVLHGHDQDDAAKRRALAPWFKTKTTLDMLIKLRCQIRDHRHPIYANITPTSNNPGNQGSPASLGISSRTTAKVEFYATS